MRVGAIIGFVLGVCVVLAASGIPGNPYSGMGERVAQRSLNSALCISAVAMMNKLALTADYRWTAMAGTVVAPLMLMSHNRVRDHTDGLGA